MDKNSTAYVFGFAAVVTLIVAVALSFTSESLRPMKEANELTYKKRDILSGVLPDTKKMSTEDVNANFDQYIKQVKVDNTGEIIEDTVVMPIDIDLKKEKKKPLEEQELPLFIATLEGQKNYIIPVRGSGLWDEIWGFIAVESDGSTIKGVSFDHKGETPGLGGEIKDNAAWKAQFIGKELFEGDEFVGIDVVKSGIKIPAHQVDGISGATITGDGVSAMIKKDIKKYVSYIKKHLKE